MAPEGIKNLHAGSNPAPHTKNTYTVYTRKKRVRVCNASGLIVYEVKIVAVKFGEVRIHPIDTQCKYF